MADHSPHAEAALIALCATAALGYNEAVGKSVWQGVLLEILPDLDRCQGALHRVRGAAANYARATEENRATTLARLRYEVALYYKRAAVERLDAWRAGKGRA